MPSPGSLASSPADPTPSAREGTPSSTPAPEPAVTAHTGAVLALLCVAVVLVQSMVAGINLAIPSLGASDLHPSRTALVWIVDVYVVVFAGLLIPAGAVGDRYGRKGTLLAGLGTFAVACLLGALAPNTGVLLASRALGGVAAALVQPATLSLALQVSPPHRRATAVAVWTASLGGGGILGNIVAGSVLQYLDWPWFFGVFVPAAIVVTVACALVVPKVPRHRASGLDPVGSLVLVAGLVALLFGIIEGPERGWTNGLVLGGFGGSVLLLTGFVCYALRVRGALLDPRVFRLPTVRAGSLGVGVSFFGLFGLFFANAQFLQDVKGYSAIATGFAILPLPIVMAALSPRSVRLAARFGARTVIGVGMGAIATGLVLQSFVHRGTPYPVYALFLMVLAAGMALSAPSLTGGILAGLPPERAGLGSGLNSAAREIGAAVGVALVGTIVNSHGGIATGLSLGYRVLAATMVVLAVPVLLWWHPPKARRE